ncbi:hypothetical protein [Desulfotignum balticum]|uniref:hypothetical protein n=1 Tax=Desulfotignum balticum TaxID=115781 RepID=UPI000462E259|nr:hypothetical protein [Desulfotignum balticum]
MTKSIDFHSILGSVSKIKLTGGVVGKVGTVLISVSFAFAIIVWSVKVVWVSALALGMLFLLCFPILWRIVSFADRNPQAAILDGAEFITLEQLRLGTKANPQLPSSQGDVIEETPVTLSPEEIDSLQDPDTPQLAESEDGNEEVKNG